MPSIDRYSTMQNIYNIHWRQKNLEAPLPHPALQITNKHLYVKGDSASIGHAKVISILDQIRLNEGIHEMKSIFYRLVRYNEDEALNLINDENLSFPSLFLLRSEIEALGLFDKLNVQNKIALELTHEIVTGKKNVSAMVCSSCDYIQTVYSVLRWIVETGFVDDGLNNEYDQVLDGTAILLSTVYKDRTILPIIVDMIFARYQKGLYIHDLVWAFFESRDPSSLMLVANYLKSTQSKDILLAHKLLGFIPAIVMDNSTDTEKQYTAFIQWMKENHLFLCFTGDSWQQTHNPIPYRVDFGAKYLCKPILGDTGKTIEPFTEKERKCLDAFEKLDKNTKIFLSRFSFILHQEDIDGWNRWMDSPIAEQIKVAEDRIGGIA